MVCILIMFWNTRRFYPRLRQITTIKQCRADYSRILLFNFKFLHLPGKAMGFNEILSGLPSGKALPACHYDKDFDVATISKIRNTLSN